jgi:hypothetical protein
LLLATIGLPLGPRQAQEGSGFVEHVAKAIEPPVHGDQVEQVAMLSGGGVGLMCS